MSKPFKWTVLVIVGLIVFSQLMKATEDIAYMHCKIIGADRVDGSDPKVLSDVMNQYPLYKYAHLEKRIVVGGINFYWVDPEGSFDGREQHILSVFDTKYSNEQHETDIIRTIDRESLVHRITYRGDFWIERQCRKIPRVLYEKERIRSQQLYEAKRDQEEADKKAKQRLIKSNQNI